MKTLTAAKTLLCSAALATLVGCSSQLTDAASGLVDSAASAAAMAAAEAVAASANAAAEAAGAPGGIVTPKHVHAAADAAKALGASVETGQNGIAVTVRDTTVYVCAMRAATVSITPCPHAAP